MDDFSKWETNPISNAQEKWLRSISGTLDSWYIDKWYDCNNVQKWITDVLNQEYYVKKAGVDTSGNFRSDDMSWINNLRIKYKLKNERI